VNEERDDGTTEAPTSVAHLLLEVDRQQLPLAQAHQRTPDGNLGVTRCVTGD
jgi:hypothetical protein